MEIKELKCSANLKFDGTNDLAFSKGLTYKINTLSYDGYECIDNKNGRHIISKEWLMHFEPVLTLKQKQAKFLKDTIDWFSNHPLAISPGGRCKYELGCAIGVRIKRISLRKKLDNADLYNSSTAVCNDQVFNDLPDYLKELTQPFLKHLQNMHDLRDKWQIGGLSDKGKIEVERIISRYDIQAEYESLTKKS